MREPRPVRPEQSKRAGGCPALAAHTSPVCGSTVTQTIVTKFPPASSPSRNLVRLREQLPRIGVEADERAEGEFRERHLGSGLDPVTARVAEDDCELAAGQRQEVVDVAADFHARRTTRRPRRPPAQGPPAARGAGASAASCPRRPSADGKAGRCRSRGPPDRRRTALFPRPQGRCGARGRARRPSTWPAAPPESRSGRRRRSSPARGRERAARTTIRACVRSRVEHQRPSHPEEPPPGELLHRLVSRHERAQRLLEPRVGNVDRAGDELVAPPVLHPDDCRIRLEELDGRARHGVERRVEREALRERARDLVQGAQALGGLPFSGESLLALRREPLRPLVQLRVLDGDRELARRARRGATTRSPGARAREEGRRQAGRSAPLGRRAARRAPRRSAPR